MRPEFFDRYFPLLFGFSLLCGLGTVIASILHRRSRGKPILFSDVPGARFVERAASGHSNRSWYTRISGASRCLVVAVSDERLIIRPRFPFNLMFLPESFGLEYDVPLDLVTRVEAGERTPGELRVVFRDMSGVEQDVTLYLQKPQEFVAALGNHGG